MIIKKNKNLGCFDNSGRVWRIVEITSGRVELVPLIGPEVKLVVSKTKYKESYWHENKALIV